MPVSTPSVDTEKELRGLLSSGVREIGSQAVWSVSSSKAGYGVDLLRDGNAETFWQSDGLQPHQVNVQFHRKAALSKLAIYVNYKLDESYTPSRLSIRTGSFICDLLELKNVEWHEPSGWQVVDLCLDTDSRYPQPAKAFILQSKPEAVKPEVNMSAVRATFAGPPITKVTAPEQQSMYGALCADPTSALLDPTLFHKDTTFTKIFVGGLPYHTTDKTLREYFDQFGDIEEAVVITDRQTGKSKGYGFVTMKDRSGAERACKDPNPIIDGRKANVNLAYLGAKPRANIQLAGQQFSTLAALPAILPNRLGLPAQYYYPAVSAASPLVTQMTSPSLLLPQLPTAQSMTQSQLLDYSGLYSSAAALNTLGAPTSSDAYSPILSQYAAYPYTLANQGALAAAAQLQPGAAGGAK